ncbi:MAG: hypothetical protein LBB42_02350 [Coriobacteriales bacterium]|jgi:CRISPR type III-A/MTUBE-associated protein Csm6|nr:hypothetical protein [Coriobacteriales bacterium]
MTVLFSPIGTADPLSQLGDGPMLHIVRHHQPEKVVLFLSPAMAEIHHQDGRYTKAIELLAESAGQKAPCVEPHFSEHSDVHVYDHYIEEFEAILEKIESSNKGAQVLANTSSGTPAMQQALVALDAFGRHNLKALQVATPRKGPNERYDREESNDFDLDTLWELNSDNFSDAESRILEVSSPNFSDRLLKDNILELIENYNYAAASKLAFQVKSMSHKTKELIEGAEERLNLDGSCCPKAFGGTEVAYAPSKKLFEYLNMLEVRLQQEQWADFTRALTPAITETMLALLRPVLPEEKFLKSGVAERLFDTEKINADEKLRTVLGEKDPTKKNYLNSSELLKLIREFSKQKEIEKCEKLRGFEKGARNYLAHEIKRANKKAIEKMGGYSIEDIFKILVDLNKETLGLYQRINRMIVESLKQEGA